MIIIIFFQHGEFEVCLLLTFAAHVHGDGEAGSMQT